MHVPPLSVARGPPPVATVSMTEEEKMKGVMKTMMMS
jgi:hypothetical protein